MGWSGGSGQRRHLQVYPRGPSANGTDLGVAAEDVAAGRRRELGLGTPLMPPSIPHPPPLPSTLHPPPFPPLQMRKWKLRACGPGWSVSDRLEVPSNGDSLGLCDAIHFGNVPRGRNTEMGP